MLEGVEKQRTPESKGNEKEVIPSAKETLAFFWLSLLNPLTQRKHTKKKNIPFPCQVSLFFQLVIKRNKQSVRFLFEDFFFFLASFFV